MDSKFCIGLHVPRDSPYLKPEMFCSKMWRAWPGTQGHVTPKNLLAEICTVTSDF